MNFTTLLLSGHKSGERIQKQSKLMSYYFNSKCKHQAAAIQTCVSDSASEKSAAPKVSVSQTYPHRAWELFSHVSP